MDYYDYPHDGPTATTLVLALMLIGVIVALSVVWIIPKSPPSQPPKTPGPGLAPVPPGSVSAKIEAELSTLRTQITAYGTWNAGPIMDPAMARILDIIRNYELRVASHHEACRKLIEK